jgi:hypothetical protein
MYGSMNGLNEMNMEWHVYKDVKDGKVVANTFK